MLFYTVWDFCEMVFVYFVYVETKGPTLEEIARIFDGEDAVAHVSVEDIKDKDIVAATTHEEEVFQRKVDA